MGQRGRATTIYQFGYDVIDLTIGLYIMIYEVRTSDSTNKTTSFKLDLYLTHKRLGESKVDSKLKNHRTQLDVDAPLASVWKQCHIDQIDI